MYFAFMSQFFKISTNDLTEKVLHIFAPQSLLSQRGNKRKESIGQLPLIKLEMER